MIIIVPKVHVLYNITLPPMIVTNCYNHQIVWKTTSKLFNVHVKDVVTDWSYALTGFIVSMLFGVSPGQS